MSKANTLPEITERDNPEGKAVWTHERGKSKVIGLDLRKVQPHPDNMRNASGQQVFGVALKEDTLDADELIPQIVAAGGIVEKPVVSKRGNGDYVMLRGHRRQAAVCKMLQDPLTPKGLADSLTKVDCEVYEGLTAEQEADMLQDQNSKPYLFFQDMLWFWTMLKAGYSFRSLLERILSRKGNASDTATVNKRAEVKGMTGKEREKFLFDWFKGTFQYYYGNAFELGPIVQKNALLTERLKEFPDGELPYFFTATTPRKKINSQERIGALITARNADKAANAWNPLSGGPAFNAKVEEFHNEDFDAKGNVIAKAVTPTNGFTPIKLAELNTRVEKAKSPIEEAAFKIARGEAVPTFDNLADIASQLDAKRKFHNDNRMALPEDKRKQLDVFFNASYEDFQTAYKALLTK